MFEHTWRIKLILVLLPWNKFNSNTLKNNFGLIPSPLVNTNSNCCFQEACGAASAHLIGTKETMTRLLPERLHREEQGNEMTRNLTELMTRKRMTLSCRRCGERWSSRRSSSPTRWRKAGWTTCPRCRSRSVGTAATARTVTPDWLL